MEGAVTVPSLPAEPDRDEEYLAVVPVIYSPELQEWHTRDGHEVIPVNTGRVPMSTRCEMNRLRPMSKAPGGPVLIVTEVSRIDKYWEDRDGVAVNEKAAKGWLPLTTDFDFDEGTIK